MKPSRSSQSSGHTAHSQSEPASESDLLRSHKNFWTNPFTVFLGTIVLFFMAQILAGIGSVPLKSFGLSDNQAMAIFMVLDAVIVFGVIAVWLSLMRKKWPVIGWNVPQSARIFGWLPLILLGYFMASYTLTILATKFIPGFDVNQAQDIGFKHLLQPTELLLAFLTLVVLTPLVEETLFRGLLFRGFRKRLPFWVAAIFSSLLFAAAHLQLNVAIDTFVMGAICCYVAEKSDSILPSILIHMIKNGLAFVLLFAFQVK